MVLAEQQHKYLSLHLPQYSLRLITGSDSPDLWRSQEIWDAVLLNINLVISTPQILLDGLRLAFVRLKHISLLVVDEAHHATNNSPSNLIMQEMYHRDLRRQRSAPELGIPHVLGLTASPITTKLANMGVLEKNLDAVCRTPTRQLEEYRGHVHMPQFVTLSYPPRESRQSLPIQLMLNILDTVDINEDPWVKHLLGENRPDSIQKYEKVLKGGKTYCTDQLRMLRTNTDHLYTQLGGWATHVWLREVLLKLQTKVERADWMTSLSDEENRYLNGVLREIRDLSCNAIDQGDLMHQLSSKACSLIDFLVTEFNREDVSCVVFVERRSMAFALAKLLEAHPLILCEVATFVGVKNSAKKDNLIDLGDPASQKIELEQFRTGARSIVVATSVMEEGIDVQATNLVIRFDDSMTVRSYIQSRGKLPSLRTDFSPN